MFAARRQLFGIGGVALGLSAGYGAFTGYVAMCDGEEPSDAEDADVVFAVCVFRHGARTTFGKWAMLLCLNSLMRYT